MLIPFEFDGFRTLGVSQIPALASQHCSSDPVTLLCLLRSSCGERSRWAETATLKFSAGEFCLSQRTAQSHAQAPGRNILSRPSSKPSDTMCSSSRERHFSEKWQEKVPQLHRGQTGASNPRSYPLLSDRFHNHRIFCPYLQVAFMW